VCHHPSTSINRFWSHVYWLAGCGSVWHCPFGISPPIQDFQLFALSILSLIPRTRGSDRLGLTFDFLFMQKIATGLKQIRWPGIEIVATIRLWLVAPVVLLEIDCPLPEGNLTVSFWESMTAVGRLLTKEFLDSCH